MARALHKPRLSRPVLWAGLCVTAATVTVQLTRTGVDVLGLMIAGFVLLVLERTLGDWIADSLGPAATAFVFACVAAIGVSYSMSIGGRAKAQRVFAAAEARGYHTLFFTLDDSKGAAGDIDDAVGLSKAVRGAGDAMRPSGTSRTGIPPGRTPGAPGPPDPPKPALVGGGGGANAPARSPGGSQGGGSAGTIRSPAFGGGGGGGDDDQIEGGPVKILRLILNPEVVMTGDRVTLRALVNGRSDPPALIEFSIDGHTVSTAPIGRDSIAKATFSTRAPGQYTVRARIVGGPMRITEVSALLSVLPGRR
jgi:hypothetical protein